MATNHTNCATNGQKKRTVMRFSTIVAVMRKNRNVEKALRSLIVGLSVLLIASSSSKELVGARIKHVKDGKLTVEATVVSLVDFETEIRFRQIIASTGGFSVDYYSFNVRATDGTPYACQVKTSEYPLQMLIGDHVTIEGVAMHTDDGVSTSRYISRCKITDRQPGPARIVTIAGVIREKQDFPGDPQLKDGPSESFKIESYGKAYTSFVRKAMPEFRDYRLGDKITVGGVLPTPDKLSIERCQVLSHTAGS